MKIALLLSIFTLLGSLTSCQVKETTESGLVSGHLPTTNSFTLQTPASGTLVAGDALTLVLSFPYPVVVDTSGGTPSLAITIGATSRSAVYASGDGTNNLTFRYTVGVGDNDTDGVTFTGISLNGSTLKFSNNGISTNCSTTLGARTFTSVLVDNTAPTLVSGMFLNAPNLYKVGDTINVALTYSEKVYVTGTPRLRTIINRTLAGNNTPIYFEYASGSGTKTLNFSFEISIDDRHTTGTLNFDATVDLNGGTIKDGAQLAAPITLGTVETTLETLSSTTTAAYAIRFSGRMPVVDSISVPTPGTYASAQTLDFALEFDRPVTVVTGTELSLPILIGPNATATTKKAHYNAAASTSTSLVFRYVTVPGDVDADGIQTATQLTMTGATITSTASTESFVTSATILSVVYRNNDLTVPSVSGIKISASQPLVQSVSIAPDTSGAYGVGSTSDNYFKLGEDMIITLVFNDNMYVGQTGGTPRIPITVGGTTKYANYLSGGDGQTSLIFRYTVEDGDSDTDGITLSPNIELNGGTITNLANTNTLTTIPTTSFPTRMVDGIRPSLSTVTPPADGSYSIITTPQRSQMDFTTNWSEAVRVNAIVNLPFIINVTTRNAVYSSGNNTAAVVFRYTVVAGDTSDTNGITMVSPMAITTGSIFDSHGNAAVTPLEYTVPSTPNVLVDRTAPSIVSVTPPLAGRYIAGQTLDFIFTFSESVDVNIGGGAPYIQITIGPNTRNATVPAGSGTTHTFSYTILPSDTDPDTLTYFSSSITIPGVSYIRDVGASALSSTTFADPTFAGTVQVDEVAPTVASASTTAGTYVGSGDGTSTIRVSLTMSEAVSVDTTDGTPAISLALATGNVDATYNAGASTSTILRFDYAVDGSTDMDLNGLALGNPSIQLNDGTIQDAQANDATLTIGTVTNLATVYVVPRATVWMKGSTTNNSGFTSKPTISTSASLAASYYQFDGTTNSLTFGGVGINPVHVLYMALRSPATGDTYAQNLVGGGSISLDNNTINMTTPDGPDVRCSTSGYSGSGTNHNGVFTPSTLQQCEFIFTGGATLPSAPFIPVGYSGRVAEILIFESSLSAGQRTEVYNYLNSAY